MAIAQTGTGKTAAFAIPVLNMLHMSKPSSRAKNVRCLVMVPTRELATQIGGVFQRLGRYTRVKVACIVGGVEQDEQVEQLRSGVDILIATPGRMFDLKHQGYIDYSNLEILILDEADHMLDLGFIKDIRDIVASVPTRRQTLFFSATISKTIKTLAYSLVNKPVRIQISPKNPVARSVDHSVAFVNMDDKRFFLERLVSEFEGSKILVFVRTKVRAERVCAAMARVGITAKTIHGGKDQKERFSTLEEFRNGTIKMLIATDVSARGIDIPGVQYVVNYDLPEVDENYVHRVGRTGRGNAKGLAVSFCSPEEEPLLEAIEDYIGSQVKVMEISKTDYEETLDLSEGRIYNWQALIDNQEQHDRAPKKKKKKKKK